MSSLRMVFLLLALLSGGLAHASYPFDNVPRASDEELDRMRGGFVVNWNGQEFLMPFSIDGIERLTQINGQTFINGVLVSPRVNPQALIPLTQLGQISVPVPAIAGEFPAAAQAPGLPTTANVTPALAGPESAPPAGAEVPFPATVTGANAGSSETATAATSPLVQTASGSDANLSSAAPVTLDNMPGEEVTTVSGLSVPVTTPAANTQVTTLGSLIVIQNGTVNSFALPAGASLDSLATIIQNSVNEQVIRNITTMNITLDAQMLAAQARLNSILNQHGLR